MSESDQSNDTVKNLLLAVTSRAFPGSKDIHNHIPLAAGQYRTMIVKRNPGHTASCGCQTCENSERFTMHQESLLPNGDVIIVVHGFNCTEIGGINTAFHIQDALYAWNIPLASPHYIHDTAAPHVIGFTWPCKHDIFPGYIVDKEGVARFAAFSFANLLLDLQRENPRRRIKIVAHSMGCFLTLKALNMIAILHGLQNTFAEPIIDDVIWLAPDINASALERTTPETMQKRRWSRPRSRTRMTQLFRRPQQYATPTTQEIATIEQELATEIKGHPIDGYGYAALDAIGRLSVYSSLNDPAMWISPLANIGTEESDSADGRIRLGWCGPLHPGLMMLQDATHHRREVILNECSQIVFDHGAYFFAPAIQRDIALRIRENASHRNTEGSAEQTPLTPPPERVPLKAWHAGAPLQFPLTNDPLPPGLQFFAFEHPQSASTNVTLPQAGAPVATATQASLIANTVLHDILAAAIRITARYYRIGP